MEAPSHKDAGRPINLLVHQYVGQWDESQQRMRATLVSQLRDERRNYASVSSQVFVQHGRISKLESRVDGEVLAELEPFFCKSRLLQTANADSIRGRFCRFFRLIWPLQRMFPSGLRSAMCFC